MFDPTWILQLVVWTFVLTSKLSLANSFSRHRAHVSQHSCHNLKIYLADVDDVDIDKSCNGIPGVELWSKFDNPVYAPYASEASLIKTLLHRANHSNTQQYTNLLEEADIVVVAHCSVAFMHWHVDNGTYGPVIRPDLTATPILAEKMKKYPATRRQSVAFVNAHDIGRGLMRSNNSQYISMQHNGDYTADFIWHNTIVTVPFGRIDASVPDASARANAAYFAGSVFENNLKYSWGLRQQGAQLYGSNQSKYVVYHTKHAPNYAEEMERHRYCLYLPGWVGWSGRFFNILNAACVPVFVLDRTMVPFEDVVNWSEMALFLTEKEFMDGMLPTVLRDVSYSRYEALFYNLLELRSLWFNTDITARIYSDDMGSLLEQELCKAHRKRK